MDAVVAIADTDAAVDADMDTTVIRTITAIAAMRAQDADRAAAHAPRAVLVMCSIVADVSRIVAAVSVEQVVEKVFP